MFCYSNCFLCNGLELSGTHTDAYHTRMSARSFLILQKCCSVESVGSLMCAVSQHWLVSKFPVYPAVRIPWNNAQWHAGMRSSSSLATYNLACPLLRNCMADLETSGLDAKSIDNQGMINSYFLPFVYTLCSCISTCFPLSFF